MMTNGGAGTGHEPARRLCAYTLGFLAQRRIRRILELSGWRLSLGWPSRGDAVAVWGRKPVSARGRWVARRSGADVLTIEDGFLRSMHPGVSGAPPLSLIFDDIGIYYDGSAPSRLEHMLQELDLDAGLKTRAGAGIELLKSNRLSKYTPPVPARQFESGHVLVVDQTAGDASIPGAGASGETFRRMLDAARTEHPGAPVVIKTHPDVLSGHKEGHFAQADLREADLLLTDQVNPWDVIENAKAVYTVSSQMGYEALLAGHKVRVFGTAFYSGWGLTEDETSCPRRTVRLSVEALFAACHLKYPVYYDAWRDRLCDFETAVEVLAHQVRAATPPSGIKEEAFAGVRLWKRRNVSAFRPELPHQPSFNERAVDIQCAPHRQAWLWAGKHDQADARALRAHGLQTGFVEDGFLRSVGLGAALTEAASLVFDRQGIYFDPGHPSDLEDLIARAAAGEADIERAARLRAQVVQARVTKYNTGEAAIDAGGQGRQIVLVPGQVEDDASILRACSDVRTNFALLKAARAACPDAWLIYKPHPDVEAGLRAGRVDGAQARELCDEIAEQASVADLLDRADEVWTLTSLMGFEALLRGKSVTCLGTPFYSGWGLTTDLGPPVARRTARPDLDALVWAALIAYPRYLDPVSGLPCPAEVVVERLATGIPMRQATILSKLQQLFAAQSWLWRH